MAFVWDVVTSENRNNDLGIMKEYSVEKII